MPSPTATFSPAPDAPPHLADGDPTLQWSDLDFLWRYLQVRDAYCPLCRYNLRGLQSDTCPECGSALRLGVSLVDTFLRAWLTAFIPVVMAGGVGVLFVFAIIAEGAPPDRNPFMIWGVWGAILHIPIAVVLLAARRPFMRLTRSGQWGLAAVLGFLAASVFVAFIIAITTQ